jgi:hypothetical protein
MELILPGIISATLLGIMYSSISLHKSNTSYDGSPDLEAGLEER